MLRSRLTEYSRRVRGCSWSSGSLAVLVSGTPSAPSPFAVVEWIEEVESTLIIGGVLEFASCHGY